MALVAPSGYAPSMCLSLSYVVPLLLIVGGFSVSWAYKIGHTQGVRELEERLRYNFQQQELQHLKQENAQLRASTPGRP